MSLAGAGVGVYEGVQTAVERTLRITGSHEPGPDRQVYADYYPRYRALYPALAGEFAELAATVSRHLEGR